MEQINKSPALAYSLSVIVAMLLLIVPWPMPFLIVAPDWVILSLIYWALATPEAAGVGKAWLVGLLVDVLTGQLMGQYAFTYAATVFLCVKQHKRIRNFPIIQQSLVIFLILLFARLLIFWLERIDHQVMPLYFWLPVLTGSIVWPVVYTVLRKVRLS
ncbi:MAG: rod shape-determining protein MreD [Methyloprofundus sp.]|nr:rod shape-determining protein MreD [Methyloprofundus sp.]